MKEVLKYLRPYWFRISIGMTIKIIGTLMDLVIPWILAYIINEVTDPKEMIFLGLIMVVCALVGLFGNIIANAMASKVGKLFTTALRHDVFTKINELSLSQVDNLTIPSLISRMTNDTYYVHQMITMIQRIGTRAPILLIGGIIITLTLDAKLTLILLATLPLIVVIIFVITKRGIPIYSDVQTSSDEMVRVIRENITGIRVIKALSKEDYEQKRFDNVTKNLFEREKKAGINMALTNPLINAILNVGLVIVIFFGAYRVYNGEIKVGIIIAFTSYFTIILNAMVTLGRIFITHSKAVASARRIKEILDIPLELQRENIEEKESDYFIEYNNVGFSYLKSNELFLKDINFKLKKGQKIGIIGPTGSGKSTIIRLLLRFYDVDCGEILINGKNIKSLDIEEYRNRIGVVLQNDAIMSDTVIENIAFGKEIDLERIKKAAQLACASEFIEKLSEGYQSMISSRGTNLSGGQKQRILLARALYADPEIFILDDSSSALDYKTDAMVRKNISNVFPDAVTFLISSRVTSLMNCDLILVIDEGMVVGLGTHHELLANCDVYQNIYSLQVDKTSRKGGVDNEL